MEQVSHGLSDTARIAKEFLETLSSREHATVVGLYGDLGAGKTTFTKALASHLGVQESVLSPTFIIERTYTVSQGPFHTFVHIDAYRLTSGDELRALRFEEKLSDPHTLIVIEWAENVEDALPEHHSVYFKHKDEESRIISWQEKRPQTKSA